jgi:Fe2+ transport system protein FeoA
MRCQLCGHEFEPSRSVCHSACPLGSHCHLICCPNCGYQVVDESKSRLAGWLRKWFPGKETPAMTAAQPHLTAPIPQTQTLPLSDLPLGTEAEIESLQELSPVRLARLSVYGLAPGCRVKLLQRHPACIVCTGETELALSHEIVRQIRVHTA